MIHDSQINEFRTMTLAMRRSLCFVGLALSLLYPTIPASSTTDDSIYSEILEELLKAKGTLPEIGIAIGTNIGSLHEFALRPYRELTSGLYIVEPTDAHVNPTGNPLRSFKGNQRIFSPRGDQAQLKILLVVPDEIKLPVDYSYRLRPKVTFDASRPWGSVSGLPEALKDFAVGGLGSFKVEVNKLNSNERYLFVPNTEYYEKSCGSRWVVMPPAASAVPDLEDIRYALVITSSDDCEIKASVANEPRTYVFYIRTPEGYQVEGIRAIDELQIEQPILFTNAKSENIYEDRTYSIDETLLSIFEKSDDQFEYFGRVLQISYVNCNDPVKILANFVNEDTVASLQPKPIPKCASSAFSIEINPPFSTNNNIEAPNDVKVRLQVKERDGEFRDLQQGFCSGEQQDERKEHGVESFAFCDPESSVGRTYKYIASAEGYETIEEDHLLTQDQFDEWMTGTEQPQLTFGNSMKLSSAPFNVQINGVEEAKHQEGLVVLVNGEQADFNKALSTKENELVFSRIINRSDAATNDLIIEVKYHEDLLFHDDKTKSNSRIHTPEARTISQTVEYSDWISQHQEEQAHAIFKFQVDRRIDLSENFALNVTMNLNGYSESPMNYCQPGVKYADSEVLWLHTDDNGATWKVDGAQGRSMPWIQEIRESSQITITQRPNNKLPTQGFRSLAGRLCYEGDINEAVSASEILSKGSVELLPKRPLILLFSRYHLVEGRLSNSRERYYRLLLDLSNQLRSLGSASGENEERIAHTSVRTEEGYEEVHPPTLKAGTFRSVDEVRWRDLRDLSVPKERESMIELLGMADTIRKKYGRGEVGAYLFAFIQTSDNVDTICRELDDALQGFQVNKTRAVVLFDTIAKLPRLKAEETGGRQAPFFKACSEQNRWIEALVTNSEENFGDSGEEKMLPIDAVHELARRLYASE